MMNMNLELIVRPYVDKVEKWEFDEVVLEYSGAVKISFKYGGRKVGDTLTFCKKDLARYFLDLLRDSVNGEDEIRAVCQAYLSFYERC
ncbi:hypothetical protein [Bacteroides xylanisolvens]|jgi:hypothetical protein|nr:hypothetical protein [Bacteroides xylanisolvens]